MRTHKLILEQKGVYIRIVMIFAWVLFREGLRDQEIFNVYGLVTFHFLSFFNLNDECSKKWRLADEDYKQA